jgi:predicted glycoside hydrolase/deacetylase ChbG (UPF0249 family)
VPTTRHFRGLALGYGFSAAALARVLRQLHPGVTELMCHPGYPDAALAATTTYTVGRERELAALTEPAILAIVMQRGISLESWAEAAVG